MSGCRKPHSDGWAGLRAWAAGELLGPIRSCLGSPSAGKLDLGALTGAAARGAASCCLRTSREGDEGSPMGYRKVLGRSEHKVSQQKTPAESGTDLWTCTPPPQVPFSPQAGPEGKGAPSTHRVGESTQGPSHDHPSRLGAGLFHGGKLVGSRATPAEHAVGHPEGLCT